MWQRVIFGVTLVALVASVTACSGDLSPLSAGPRPANACTLLTSDQVAQIIGKPGPYTGLPEDPDENGKPVWGCTWDTHLSYADLSEVTSAHFAQGQPGSTPVSGIGDTAFLIKGEDGADSYLYFRTGARYYQAQVTVDRYTYRDSPNFAHEADAAQQLARIVAPRLAN